jgi:acetyl-CoA synthetase
MLSSSSGSCTLPFFGIDLALVDPASGKEVVGNDVEGVMCVKRPWPSVARTVYGDHERYLTVYMKPYPGPPACPTYNPPFNSSRC